MLPAESSEADTTSSVAKICNAEDSLIEPPCANISSFSLSFCKSRVVYLLAIAQMPKHAASRTFVPMEDPDVDRCSKTKPRRSALRIGGNSLGGIERR